MANRALQLERTTSAESVNAFYRRAGLSQAADPSLIFALALPQTWQHEIMDQAPTAEAPVVRMKSSYTSRVWAQASV